MRYIVLDMEFNMLLPRHVYDKKRSLAKCFKNEVIQIAGYSIDDNANIINKTNSYCSLNISTKIHKSITKLTGITTEKLEKEGINFKYATKKIIEDLSVTSSEATLIITWGCDDEQIFKKHLMYYFGKNPPKHLYKAKYIDVQKGLSRYFNVNFPISLETVASMLDMDFVEENLHNAAYDSYIVVKLLQMLGLRFLMEISEIKSVFNVRCKEVPIINRPSKDIFNKSPNFVDNDGNVCCLYLLNVNAKQKLVKRIITPTGKFKIITFDYVENKYTFLKEFNKVCNFMIAEKRKNMNKNRRKSERKFIKVLKNIKNQKDNVVN